MMLGFLGPFMYGYATVSYNKLWTKGEVGAPWNRFKPHSKKFIDLRRQCFFCEVFMLFLSCFCFAFVRVLFIDIALQS